MNDFLLILLALSVVFAPVLVVFLLLESQRRSIPIFSPIGKHHDDSCIRV